MNPAPLADCKPEDIQTDHHALVYGRTRVWFRSAEESTWHWSKFAWWKAMWYPHRGPPSDTTAWGVYGGADGRTGPGDAELSHWMPMPAKPAEGPKP